MTVTLKRVSIDLIDADPDNPRRSLGDLKDLTESIKQVGILQPPVVTNNAGDKGERYSLIAGHRRTAAARAAGHTEIDVVVTDALDAKGRATAMLVENLQRKDLDPIEEATGYFKAQEAGMKLVTLAKAVGRSQSHVRDRLRLLELPADVAALVKKRELDANKAIVILELEDPKDQKVAAATMLDRDFEDAGRIVDRIKGEKQTNEKMAEAKAKYAEANIAVLSNRPGYDSKAKRVGSELFFKGVAGGDANEKAHETEPCNAVLITPSYGGRIDVSHYCTDPTRHSAKGASVLKRHAGTTGSSMDPLEKANRAWNREVQSQSKAFLGEVLQRVPKQADVIERLTDEILKDKNRQHTQRALCEIFDLEIPTSQENRGNGKTATIKHPEKAVAKFLKADPRNRVKVAFALTFIGYQNNVADLEGVVQLGYTPPAKPTKATVAKAEKKEPTPKKK